MPANKTVAITAEYANSIHAKRLAVFPGLILTCFVRDSISAARGPLFVVREIDVKIIRNKHAGINKPSSSVNAHTSTQHTLSHTVKSGSSSSFLTEQAIRASVRQAVLNMNLALEPASKQEIQYLKHIGILGKRAPSCSLLDGNDMALLLEAFGRTYASTELRNAVSTITVNHNYTVLLPPTINSSDADQFNVGVYAVSAQQSNDVDTVANDNTNTTSGPLPQLKRQLIRKRKLQRLLSDNSKPSSDQPIHHRKRTVSEPCPDGRDGNSADEVSDNLSTGSNSSNGLDCLLSALSSPSSTTATVTVASTPQSQLSSVSSQLSTPQHAIPVTQQYGNIVYPTTMYNSINNKLFLNSPIPPLPAQLPTFTGTAHYSAQRILAPRNSTADIHNASSIPNHASTVTQPPIYTAPASTMQNLAPVASNDGSNSPTSSDELDTISNKHRQQYLANVQPRLAHEIEI